MKFAEILEVLRDGHYYSFTHPALPGDFFKAAYPSRDTDVQMDGACSAITFWRNGLRASPTFLLDDFERDDWTICRHAKRPPYFRKPEDIKS